MLMLHSISWHFVVKKTKWTKQKTCIREEQFRQRPKQVNQFSGVLPILISIYFFENGHILHVLKCLSQGPVIVLEIAPTSLLHILSSWGCSSPTGAVAFPAEARSRPPQATAAAHERENWAKKLQQVGPEANATHRRSGYCAGRYMRLWLSIAIAMRAGP